MTTDFQQLTAREQHTALFIARRLYGPLAKVAGVIVETERCSKKPPSGLPVQVCQMYQDMMGDDEDAPGRPETGGAR